MTPDPPFAAPPGATPKGMSPLTIQVQPPPEPLTHDLMRQMLHELQAIRQLIAKQL